MYYAIEPPYLGEKVYGVPPSSKSWMIVDQAFLWVCDYSGKGIVEDLIEASKNSAYAIDHEYGEEVEVIDTAKGVIDYLRNLERSSKYGISRTYRIYYATRRDDTPPTYWTWRPCECYQIIGRQTICLPLEGVLFRGQDYINTL